MIPAVADFAARIEDVTDLETLRCELARTVEGFGFGSFAYLGLRMHARNASDPLLVSTYPVSWTDHYMEETYFSFDPVVLNSQRALMPFVWGRDGTDRDFNPDQKRLFNEAREFGIGRGVTVPIHAQGGQFSALTLASGEGERAFGSLVQEYHGELHLIALHYHTKVEALISEGGRALPDVRLSPREQECLSWAAQGKTAWEISVIIGVSRNTVLFHIKNAKKKLGVSTVNQAVVNAVMSGLINP